MFSFVNSPKGIFNSWEHPGEQTDDLQTFSFLPLLQTQFLLMWPHRSLCTHLQRFMQSPSLQPSHHPIPLCYSCTPTVIVWKMVGHTSQGSRWVIFLSLLSSKFNLPTSSSALEQAICFRVSSLSVLISRRLHRSCGHAAFFPPEQLLTHPHFYPIPIPKCQISVQKKAF